MREMKDSGHPWLGMIPASWDVVYPKVLFTQRKDKAKRGERQLTASCCCGKRLRYSQTC